MPDELEELARQIAAQPAAQPDDELMMMAREIAAPSSERAGAFNKSQAAKPYVPRADLMDPAEGQPMGIIDGAWDKGGVMGVATIPLRAIGAVLSPPQKFVATTLQNGLAMATDNPDKLVNVDWEKRGTLEGLGQWAAAPFKAAFGGETGSFEQQKGMLGIGNLSTRENYSNPDGSTDVGELGRHFADGVVDFVGNTVQDPTMLIHPGKTLAGKTANMGRIENVIARAKTGATGEALTRGATTPGFAERIAAGELGVNVRAPFTKATSGIDIPIPKALAPVGKALDWVGDKLTPSAVGANENFLSKTVGRVANFFKEPNPMTPEGIARELSTGRAEKLVRLEMTKQLLPVQEAIVRNGWDDVAQRGLIHAVETMDDAFAVRAGSAEVAGKLNEVGIPTQKGFSAALDARLKKLVDANKLTPEAAEVARVQGQAHFEQQAAALYETVAKLPKEQIADFYDAAMRMRDAGRSARELAFANGVEIPELGGIYKNAPFEALDNIEILERQIEKATGTARGELIAQQKALIDGLPEQLKAYNETPGYFPGRPSEAAQDQFFQGDKRLREPAKSSGVETAQRSFVRESGVPMTTFEISQEIKRGSGGTYATAGRKLLDEPKKGLAGVADRFLTATGYKDALEANPANTTFMKMDPVQAWQQYYTKSLFKPLRNAEVDTMTARMFKTVDPAAFEAVKRAAREGIEEATPVAREAIELRELRENDIFKQYLPLRKNLQNAERSVAERAEFARLDRELRKTFNDADIESAVNGSTVTPAGKVFKEATLTDLDRVYKAAGGKGNVGDLMRPDVLADVQAGKITLKDALKPSQPVDGMIETMLNGKKVWLHEGIARDLDAWKALGNDASILQKHMPKVSAAYSAYMNMLRRTATSHGPQFIAYNLRNALGDLWRMAQGDMLSMNTIKDIYNLYKPMREYISTGRLDKFQGMMINVGKRGMMDAADLMEEALGHQVAAGGQLRADIFEGAKKASNGFQKAKGKLGQGWNYAETVMAAREDVQRVAGYAERLRLGDSPYMAAMNVEKALFNMRRLSPAAQFARNTGLSLFTWPFKNLPFQLQYMFENPGQFAAVMRAQQAIQNGELTESQVPDWMKNKFNYVVDTRREANGHLVHSVLTDSGLNPMNDFSELMKSAESTQGGMWNWMRQNAGPLWKMAANLYTKGEIEPKELAGRWYTQFDKAVDIGQQSRDRFGNQPGVGRRVLNMFVNPLNTQEVDVNQQRISSKGRAKAEVNQWQSRQHKAQRALDMAIEKANAERADLNISTLLSGDEREFTDLRTKVEQAAKEVERAKEVAAKVRSEAERVRLKAEALNRTN